MRELADKGFTTQEILLRFSFQRKAIILFGFGWAMSAASSCSSGPAITGAAGSAAGGAKGQNADEKEGKGGGDDLGEMSNGSDFDQDGGGGEAKVLYPTFRYNGKGNSICGSMNHVTTINVETSYTEETMVVKKSNSKVYCEKSISGSDGVPDDECNKVANSAQSMEKRNQETTYVRLKGDALEKEKDDGLDFVAYAVFAKEIRSSSGRVITLSKPLPVGILPASDGRYKDVETKTWTANASDGALSFDVAIEVSKVDASPGQAQMRIIVNIPQAANDYTLYESWPMPANATYTIDTKAQSITQIAAQGKNGDGGQSRCTKRDTSSTTLTLCDRIVDGKTEPGACQFGTNALN